MHPGIFVAVVYFLLYFGAILLAVMLPISWLLRRPPGSLPRTIGFILTALGALGAVGCGLYWWMLGAGGRSGGRATGASSSTGTATA